ncbi:MAG: 50S ribosomal protein L24 [Chloroherpetonaceae bacterium]|nr:50S ribosomal protein L24 [Chloroherpetonaceae bacterium]MCS7212229.1 50S ribosomal protein L24 [Chloroherpetonaceae bacterium]MDW8018980.1 50S ribosomal protein L24 [Chloroherpetonaceae bacterium]MDW8464900.1 50S ribosomal protein L24 [Chloroherpetonaceae bacterium]
MKTGVKRPKMHIKKGDTVELLKTITSSEAVRADREKGYQGKVLRVFPETNRVIVEGVNIRRKHIRPNKNYPQGAIIEREMPIHASNVRKVS